MYDDPYIYYATLSNTEVELKERVACKKARIRKLINAGRLFNFLSTFSEVLS